MSDSTAAAQPFAFPKDLDQVFFVDDPIHAGWKLAVKVNPRAKRVCYPRDNSDEETSDGSDDESGAPTPIPLQPRRGGGRLVGVVADDDAGEEDVQSDGDAEDQENLGDDEEFDGSDGEEEEGSVEVRGADILVSDDEEEGGPGDPFVGENLVELRREELDELASDGEFESGDFSDGEEEPRLALPKP
jgi:hypothetical protein